MPLVSLSEASRATGVSRTQIYRLRDRGALVGWLHRDEKGKPLIELSGLREHLAIWSRARIDSFHFREVPAAVEPEPEQPEPLMEDLAAWANALVSDDWGPPPWDAARWSGLMGVLDEAHELAALHGPFNPELLEALSDDDA